MKICHNKQKPCSRASLITIDNELERMCQANVCGYDNSGMRVIARSMKCLTIGEYELVSSKIQEAQRYIFYGVAAKALGSLNEKSEIVSARDALLEAAELINRFAFGLAGREDD